MQLRDGRRGRLVAGGVWAGAGGADAAIAAGGRAVRAGGCPREHRGHLRRRFAFSRAEKIRFVTAPVQDFPIGDPNWGRLQLLPQAEQLWQKVIDDEPLGALGRGAISGRRQSGSKEEAAANGLCS